MRAVQKGGGDLRPAVYRECETGARGIYADDGERADVRDRGAGRLPPLFVFLQDVPQALRDDSEALPQDAHESGEDPALNKDEKRLPLCLMQERQSFSFSEVRRSRWH